RSANLTRGPWLPANNIAPSDSSGSAMRFTHDFVSTLPPVTVSDDLTPSTRTPSSVQSPQGGGRGVPVGRKPNPPKSMAAAGMALQPLSGEPLPHGGA